MPVGDKANGHMTSIFAEIVHSFLDLDLYSYTTVLYPTIF